MGIFEEFNAEPASAKEQAVKQDLIDQLMEMISAEESVSELEAHFHKIKKEQLEEFQKIPQENPFQLKTYSKKYETSLLTMAIKSGRLDATKLLVKHLGVNPQSEEDQSIDPLLLAYQQGNFEIVDFLLDRGAEKAKLIDFLLQEKLKQEQAKLEQEVLQSKTQMNLLDRLRGKPPQDIKGALKRIHKEERARLQSMSDQVLSSTLKEQKSANLSQLKLIHKFRKYLDLMKQKKPHLYPEPFFTEYMNRYFVGTGFCNGYSLLWLYKTAHGMEQLLLEDLTKISLWNESEDGLGKTVGAIFEGIINDMTLLFNAGTYFQGKSQKDFEDIIANVGDNKIKPAFSTSALMTQQEMLEHLPGLIPEGMMVKICSLNHAIACIKEGDRYKILDPNNPDGPIYVTGASQLVKHIQKFLSCNPLELDNFYNEIILSCYSKEKISKEQSNLLEIAKQKAESLNGVLLQSRVVAKKAKYRDPIEIKSINGVTGLLLACQHGDVETVKWYLKNNADTHVFIQNGQNALIFAAQNGFLPIVNLLLEYIDEPLYCAQNAGEYSPLEVAIYRGERAIVERMIQEIKKAKSMPGKNILAEILSTPSSRGNPKTPLFHCIESQHFDLIGLLVSNGANVNGKVKLADQEQPISPLLYAVQKNNVDTVRTLLICPEIQINENEPTLNPLFQAVRLGHFAIAEELVKKGAIIPPGLLPILMDPSQSDNLYKKSKDLFMMIMRQEYQPTLEDVKAAKAIRSKLDIQKDKKSMATKTIKIYELYKSKKAEITPQKDSMPPQKKESVPPSPDSDAEVPLKPKS